MKRCLAVIALLALAGPVSANHISFSATSDNWMSGSNDYLNSGDVSISEAWSGNFSLPQFDTSLGTLTGVKLVLMGKVDTSAQAWTNLTRYNPMSLQFTTTSNASLGTPSGTLVLAPGSVLVLGPKTGQKHAAGEKIAHANTLWYGKSDLSQWVGAGNMTLPYVGAATTNTDYAPADAWGFETDALQTAKVTYSYHPGSASVPETSTVTSFLVLLGGAGFLSVRSRRRCARSG